MKNIIKYIAFFAAAAMLFAGAASVYADEGMDKEGFSKNDYGYRVFIESTDSSHYDH